MFRSPRMVLPFLSLTLALLVACTSGGPATVAPTPERSPARTPISPTATVTPAQKSVLTVTPVGADRGREVEWLPGERAAYTEILVDAIGESFALIRQDTPPTKQEFIAACAILREAGWDIMATLDVPMSLRVEMLVDGLDGMVKNVRAMDDPKFPNLSMYRLAHFCEDGAAYW